MLPLPPPLLFLLHPVCIIMNILDKEQLSVDGQTMEKNALAAAPILGKQ